MKSYIISFDVGGTRLKTGLLGIGGDLIESNVIAGSANDGADVLYENLKSFISKTIKKRGNPIGIGLSLSGGVDPEKGVVLLPGKYKNLENYPLVPKLRTEFNVPVFANNDGRLAMYAARYFGKAKDVDWAVVLTIGTGIGSGVLLDGHILEDSHLQFGTQIGHIIMDKSADNFCLTGNYGTGETECSATALTLQVRAAIQRGIPSILSDKYFQNPFDIDFEKIIDACKQGDELCLRELNTWIKNLAILLINTVHSYAPKRIILSGGATLAAEMYLEKLKELVNKQVFYYSKGMPIEIVIAEDQEFTGVKGAAAYLLKRLKMI
ncbi:ROK family protein [Flavivirga eckloniae]|uniref:ROK family protein n=1 Tax=Flavivirga eckloniae TaxID=1803846 RepID=A0A2K9PN93_9FLAO|nr:ROK family protein [Flavivirga eckloniae]AUP78522.1 hypothetical protein C1H87_07280 [Flavivirga eckloniae]